MRYCDHPMSRVCQHAMYGVFCQCLLITTLRPYYLSPREDTFSDCLNKGKKRLCWGFFNYSISIQLGQNINLSIFKVWIWVMSVIKKLLGKNTSSVLNQAYVTCETTLILNVGLRELHRFVCNIIHDSSDYLCVSMVVCYCH